MTEAFSIVDVDELVALFAGEPGEGDEWSTSPFYDIDLAFAIAERTHPMRETELRERIYGDWPVDEVPEKAKTAIGLAYMKWKHHSERQQRSAL